MTAWHDSSATRRLGEALCLAASVGGIGAPGVVVERFAPRHRFGSALRALADDDDDQSPVAGSMVSKQRSPGSALLDRRGRVECHQDQVIHAVLTDHHGALWRRRERARDELALRNEGYVAGDAAGSSGRTAS
jgi:hypothetical protein